MIVDEIKFKIIDYGSIEYKKAVFLRESILRAPFGLTYSEAELLSEKDQIHIVGVEDSKIISTAVLAPEGVHCRMQRVVVKEDKVKKGIGTQMILFCEKLAKKHEFESIYGYARLSTVDFYLKMGFQPEEECVDAYSVPHLRMRKII
jgi:N-acetylglutamate synthase-like GNAT family acetyltransferase